MTKRILITDRDGVGEFLPEDHRDYLMKLEGDELIQKGLTDEETVKRVMDHEKDKYDWNVEDMKAIDKLNKDVAIIVPSHSMHIPWLKACLESCKATGYHVMLIYDNPFWKHRELDRYFPPEVMSLTDSLIIKHRTYQASVGVCHYWNMIYGLTLLKEFGFPLVFNINGDCIMEKPEGIGEIIGMLGDADLFPNQYIEEQRYCGTMGWIGKTDVMLDFYHSYREENYMYGRTTEGRLFYYVKEKELKIVQPENCEHNYRIPSSGTWYDILGFRHLHAEMKVRPSHGLPPVEEKYTYVYN